MHLRFGSPLSSGVTQIFLFMCTQWQHDITYVCSVWVGNKVAKMYSMQKSRWYSAAFALRQRMLNFVQNFEYYMMFEVIEPNWHLFQLNMDTVGSWIGNCFLVWIW